MAKNKSRVVLPGGMAGLAHKAQNGGEDAANNIPQPAPRQPEQPAPVAQNEPATAAPQSVSGTFTRTAIEAEKAQALANEGKDRTAPAAKKLPKAEGKDLARLYAAAKENGEDDWSLFLDLAKNYKERDSKLATVYIDSDLKSVLDRLKSANSIKMPSTAILSAIVARFVFEHEQDIKNAIFGDSLL